MALMRVYCGLAASEPVGTQTASEWLTVAVVDDAGRLLDVCDFGDNAVGYADLGALLAERSGGGGSVAVAADSDEHHVVLLLAAAGRPVAIVDDEMLADYADQFADDESAEEIDAGPAERHAVGLARALAAGALAASVQAAPRELMALKPVLAAHAAVATGRHGTAIALREVLRELYPAALRAYPDPAEPIPLAILDALPEPGLLGTTNAGRGRDAAVASELAAAGVADAGTITDAITALRVAIAETPRRTGIGKGTTTAVAETIREAVAAVRACDAAIGALVGLLSETVNPAPVAAPIRPVPRAATQAPVEAPRPAARRGRTPTAASAVEVPIPAPAAAPATRGTSRTQTNRPASSRPSPRPAAAAASAAPRVTTQDHSVPPPPPGITPMFPAAAQSGRVTAKMPPTQPVQAPAARAPQIPVQQAPAAPVPQQRVPAAPPAQQPMWATESIGGFAPVPAGTTYGSPPAQQQMPQQNAYEPQGSYEPYTAYQVAQPTFEQPPSYDTGYEALAYPLAPEVPAPGNRENWPLNPQSHDDDAVRARIAPVYEPQPPVQESPIPRQRDGRVPPPWQTDEIPIPMEPPALRLVERDAPAAPPALRLVLPDEGLMAPRSETVRDRHPYADDSRVDDGDGDLLIFAQARSAWFEWPDDVETEPAPPAWADIDAGWSVAARVEHPEISGQTDVGLPRRVPQANLVPGSPLPPMTDQGLRIVRDPASMAAHTTGYFRGSRRGEEVRGYAVGGRAGRDAGGGWDFSRDGWDSDRETGYRSAARR